MTASTESSMDRLARLRAIAAQPMTFEGNFGALYRPSIRRYCVENRIDFQEYKAGLTSRFVFTATSTEAKDALDAFIDHWEEVAYRRTTERDY